MVDNSDLEGLISALRAEVEADSIDPERVGYILSRIVERLDSYADSVEVSVISQSLSSALRRIGSLETDTVQLASDLATLRHGVSLLAHVVDVNGNQLNVLNERVSVNSSAITQILTQMAALGKVYCTEAEYNEMVDAGTIDPNTKYYIYES